MRVLIRTLPLKNANYGGILQNWALQQVLRDLGADAVTDTSERLSGPRSKTTRVLKDAVLRVRGAFPSDWDLIKGDRQRFADARLLRFIKDEIATTSLFRPFSSAPQRNILSVLDAFIVGSDQVWRKDYSDVQSFLLDFLPDDDRRPRVAYAASFGGVGANTWSHDELRHMAHLLRRFGAVSVREQEAVEWCARELATRVELQPDPTLLLRKEQYDKLISSTPDSGLTVERLPPYLLLYLLDDDPRASEQARHLAAERNLIVIDVDQRAPALGRQRRSVPDWLRLVRDAQAVITDSFHGMVFSTMFQRPFAVIPNSNRGLDRFSSFASRYGLAHHLADNGRTLKMSLEAETDWSEVQRSVADDRSRGITFLSTALRLPSSHIA